MSRKEMLCPNCQAKVGALKLINESNFRCGKCKKDIDIKIINSIERVKVDRLNRWTLGLMLVLFLASTAGLFLNIAASSYGLYFFIAEVVMIVITFYLYFYLIGRKRQLFDSKELKLSVKK